MYLNNVPPFRNDIIESRPTGKIHNVPQIESSCELNLTKEKEDRIQIDCGNLLSILIDNLKLLYFKVPNRPATYTTQVLPLRSEKEQMMDQRGLEPIPQQFSTH